MTVGIIGAGAWGTALAQVVASGGEDVVLWALEPEVVHAVNGQHQNPLYLPGITLDPRIRATGLTGNLADADLWLVAVPAQFLRGVLAECPVAHGAALVLCAKGIERQSFALMTDVAAAVAGRAAKIAVLSGPSFADEVARGLPTAITLAASDQALGEALVKRLARPSFRPYWTNDIIGAEIGGAVKNVLAIACGVVEGAGLGLNARSALIARGFAEMTRFGVARGARAETLAGLSGLGDLVLTCSSTNSRNYRLGVGLGQGRPVADLLATRSVAEGAATAPVLVEAAARAGVEMPIATAVADLLKGAEISGVVAALLARPLKPE